MKNKKLFFVFAVTLLLATAAPTLAANKAKLAKAVITQIDNFTITATKNSKTYTINAERAALKDAKGKKATIDQIFTGDQIDVNGNYDTNGIIVARTIKDRSLKSTDLTRRNVGSDNLENNAISDLNFISNGIITEDKLQAGTLTNLSIADNANISASKLNLTNAITTADIQNSAITSEKLADGITIPTGNFTTLDLGTNTLTDGNFNGNWNLNSGNLSGVGTISGGNITGGTYNGNALTTGTGTLTLNSYTLALSGNSQINQNLLNTSSPTFAGLTLSSPLTVPNGGTGTNTFSPNYLLKGNGTGAIQSSLIYDNGTNVGIGTTNPSHMFTMAGGLIAPFRIGGPYDVAGQAGGCFITAFRPNDFSILAGIEENTDGSNHDSFIARHSSGGGWAMADTGVMYYRWDSGLTYGNPVVVSNRASFAPLHVTPVNSSGVTQSGAGSLYIGTAMDNLNPNDFELLQLGNGGILLVNDAVGSGSFTVGAKYTQASGFVAAATQAGWLTFGGAGDWYFRSDTGLVAGNAYTPTTRMFIRGSSGYVGIGTTAPQSKLQVDGGYVQLDNNSGAPASADCDAAEEEGRIYWDATNDELYVCSGASGWRKMTTVAP